MKKITIKSGNQTITVNPSRSEEGALKNIQLFVNFFNDINTLGISFVDRALLTTVINTFAAIGTFPNGKSFFESPKLKDRLRKRVLSKYSDFPTVQEVKEYTKSKMKSGFWMWFFTGQVSDDEIRELPKCNLYMDTLEGVPVAVAALQTYAGTADLRQVLGDQTCVVACAFIKDKYGLPKSVLLGRAFVVGMVNNPKKKGNKTEESSESYDFVRDIFGI